MNKRFGFFSILAILAVVAVVLSQIALPVRSANAETVLRLAHIFSPTDPTHKGTERFAQLVEKFSEGRVKIKIFPSGQLGNNRKLFGLARSGGIDMSLTPYPLLADAVPEYNIYTAGYMYNGWEDLKKVLEHPDYGQAWNKRLLEKSGLRVLNNYFFGARTLTTTKTLVTKPSDLKGLKIRAVPNKMSLAVVTGLGGTPTPVPFPELFQGLRQGVADGQENPVPTIWAQKFYEVQKYLVLTRHQLIPVGYLINDKVWKKLDSRDQDAIRHAAIVGSDYTTELNLTQEKRLIDELAAKGMKVIGLAEGLQLDAFRKSVQAEVIKTFDGKIWPAGLADEIKAIIK
jgi:tripartite ATP-independent transporter DctP family solute receptor